MPIRKARSRNGIPWINQENLRLIHTRGRHYKRWNRSYRSGDQKKFLNTSTLCVESKNWPREAPWPSVRASDSGARGRGFDTHSGHRVVSLSKVHLPPKKYW